MFKDLLRRAVASRAASWLLRLTLFWIVAAASTAGLLSKWGLLDGQAKNGIETMLDMTARKPYVYRQLAPLLANFAERATPLDWQNRAIESLRPPDKTFVRAAAAAKPELRFRYLVVCYLSFFSAFIALFVLRRLCLDAGTGEMTAILSPASFVLAFPYLQTIGGYFYDSIELLFASLAFLLAYRGKICFFIALALPATLNKEAYFFYLPALYPLLRHHLTRVAAAAATLLAILASGCVNVLLRIAFSDAPGQPFEYHLPGNLHGYLSPSAYLRLEATYGIVGPGGAFAGTMVVILILVLRGWPSSPLAVRRHLLLAAIVNVPLLLAFCRTGELRNLSFLFVGFVILAAHALEQRTGGELPGPPPAGRP